MFFVGYVELWKIGVFYFSFILKFLFFFGGGGGGGGGAGAAVRGGPGAPTSRFLACFLRSAN